MTKPKDDDVKRYWVEHGRGRLSAIYEEKVDGLDDDAFEVVRAADHDSKVAELEQKLANVREVIEKLREQRDDWISACILNDPDVQDEEATIANYVEADDAEIEEIEEIGRGEK